LINIRVDVDLDVIILGTGVTKVTGSGRIARTVHDFVIAFFDCSIISRLTENVPTTIDIRDVTAPDWTGCAQRQLQLVYSFLV
jgi:hypothetical protein